MRHLARSIMALSKMVRSMSEKDIELGRITKTSALLLRSGVHPGFVPPRVLHDVLGSQRPDGGWVAVVDTAWNTILLRELDGTRHRERIARALAWLDGQRTPAGIWGRSGRDMGRIPVTGLVATFLPELADRRALEALEDLWVSERGSLTYKAAYTLLAFATTGYRPRSESLVEETVAWLAESREPEAGYGPWRGHPVGPNVYCTAVASLALLRHPGVATREAIRSSAAWLRESQLPEGIWRYHEIEDGASWGALALHDILRWENGARPPRLPAP